MALAIIQQLGSSGDRIRFRVDIGTNRFFQYRIGSASRRDRGIELLRGITFRSPIFETKNAAQRLLRADFILEVPANHFDANAKRIQLLSFKDKAGKGIAVSEVLRVVAPVDNKADFLFPKLSMSSENAIMEQIPVKYKSKSYSETDLSQGMFWEAVVSALPGLIKVAAPIVGGLLKGGKAKAGSNGKTGSTDKVLNAILELLNGLKNSNGISQASSVSESMAIDPATLMQLAPLLQKVASPETIQAIGDQPIKLFKAIGDAVLKMDQQEMQHLERINPGVDDPTIVPLLASMSRQNGYATAKVAPALLAALPALAPLLGKVLDPKMINAIGNQPVKLFKAIGDAVLKMDQQEMQHLENINPGVDDPTILPLLQSMSRKVGSIAIPFKYEKRIDIEFVKVAKVNLKGRSRVVYKKRSDIFFPFRVAPQAQNVPSRPIPKVIVQTIFQDAETNAVLLEKRFKLKAVRLGDTINSVSLSAEETQALPCNKDIKLELSFIWRGKKGRQNRGTFKMHHITLVDDYLFDRMGKSVGTPILLNDMIRYRPFWHKVWEGGYAKSRRWEINFDVKYFYAIDFSDEAIAKLETRRKIYRDNAAEEEEPRRREVESKLKSGMELSIEAFNHLLPQLGQTRLEEAKLKALKTQALKTYYNQVARVNLEIKGKGGDTGTVWTYPEVSLHQIHLVRPARINPFGQVTEFKPEVLLFPRPSSIHFIGTKSK
ncbi:MAG: hypothetical protein AAF985_05740 [Bacteroidota bacterium]